MDFFGLGKSPKENINSISYKKFFGFGNHSAEIETEKDEKSSGQEAESIWGRGKDTLLEASSKSVRLAIKGSGLLVRKIYETRINVVNEFSSIKPDWSFIDVDTSNHRLEKIEKDLDANIKELKKAGSLRKVNELTEALLVANSMIDGNLGKCEDIIQDNHISSPFALYGIPCLEAEEKGSREQAVELAMTYYKANNQTVEHPRIAMLIAFALEMQGEYSKAKGIVSNVVKIYPDNLELHKLLLRIHSKAGNKEGEQVERDIIELIAK